MCVGAWISARTENQMRRVGSSFELPRTRVKLVPIMDVVGFRISKRHTDPFSSPQYRYDFAAMFCPVMLTCKCPV